MLTRFTVENGQIVEMATGSSESDLWHKCLFRLIPPERVRLKMAPDQGVPFDWTEVNWSKLELCLVTN